MKFRCTSNSNQSARSHSGGRAFLLTGLLATAAFSALPARAATLEQKWQAGQKLSYDMALDGNLGLNFDATAPFLWAGLPLDIKLNGSGEIALDTRAVDESGSGTVAVLVPRLKMNGSTWGQNAQLELNDGRPVFSLNGQVMGGGANAAAAAGAGGAVATFLTQPDYGLRISRQGRVESIVALKAKPAVAEADPKKSALPINVEGLLRSVIVQVLPTFWPARDVQMGETWSSPSRLPIPTNKAADTPGPAFQLIDLGKFDFTLAGEEEAEGRKTFRVAVLGNLDVDKARAGQINDAVGGKANGNKLTSASQKVTGDLWFDATAGQLVRANLKLNTQLAGVGVTPAKDGKGKAQTWGNGQSFNGTLKLQLRKVSYASALATDAPATP
ncbi:MAG TPA: hypothetical protein VF719_06300 [Abditibacteriaceae bacterium]